MLVPQVQLAVGAEVRLHRAAHGPTVLPAQCLPIAFEHARQRRRRRDVAIRLGDAARHAETQAGGDAAAHRAFQRAPVEAFVGARGIAVEVRPAGVVADVLDQAAGGIAAEQRALRPAQHFHALHIEQLAGNAVDRAHVGIVDIDRDRAFQIVGEVVLRNAAQVEDGDVGRPGVKLKPRNVLRDLGGVGHAQRLQLIARERGDRDRHLGDVLGPLGGGHHDIAETASRVLGGGLRFLRVRRPGHAGDRNRHGQTARRRFGFPEGHAGCSLIAGTNWCFC